MNFSISTKVLYNSLVHVQKAISSRSPSPILSGIKFTVKENSIELVASNSDVSIYTIINDESLIVIEPGTIVLAAKYVVEIVRKISDKNICFTNVDGNLIRIKTENSVFDLNGFDAYEYPNIDFTLPQDFIKFPKTQFKQIVSETSFAVATAEGHPILTGVNFSFQGSKLEILGTNSFRLAKKEIKLENESSQFLNCVISGKNLDNLVKMFDDNGDLQIYFFQNRVIFKFDNVVYMTKLIDGKFPNVERLFQYEFNQILELDTRDLLDSIDRASLLTNDRSKNIVKLSFKNAKLTVKSTTPEIGKVVETINPKFSDCKDFDFAFSAHYVIEALRVISSDTVQLCFVDNVEVRPFLLKNPKDSSTVHLVLPVKTY